MPSAATLVLAVALAASLWRRRGSERWLALACVALTAAAAIVCGLALVATLRAGTRATSVRRPDAPVFRAIAVTNESAWLQGETTLVRLALDDGSVRATLPFGRWPITSVARADEDGRTLVVTYQGHESWGWALLDDEHWIVAPHLDGAAFTLHSAYFDAKLGRAVLASTSLRDSDGLRAVSLRTLSRSGSIEAEERWSLRSSLPVESFCRLGDTLYATRALASGDACVVGPLEDGARGCAKTFERAVCPSALVHDVPALILDAGAPRAFVTPPASLPVDASSTHQYFIRLDGPRTQPTALWYGGDIGVVAGVEGGWISVHVEDDATARVVRWTALGAPIAAASVRDRPAFPSFLFPRDHELDALFTAPSYGYARFDTASLARLDARASELLTADVAALAIALAVAPLFALAAFLARSRGADETRIKRIALCYGCLAVPTMQAALTHLGWL